MKKNNKYPDYKSYQFVKYHTFDAFTQENVQSMLYGEQMNKSTLNGTHIIKYYKELGFVTGHSEILLVGIIFSNE